MNGGDRLLDKLLALETEGEWQELLAIDLTAFSLCGDDLARAYIAKSKAYQATAKTVDDYRECLRFSQLAEGAAVPGGYNHLWALCRVSCQLADLGHYEEAERAARDVLKGIPEFEESGKFLPYAYFVLGLVAFYSKRNYRDAAVCFERALPGSDNWLSERLRLNLVWAYAQAGDAKAATAALPNQTVHVSPGNHAAAKSVALFVSGRLSEAVWFGRQAIRDYDTGSWSLTDTIEAAEVCQILKLCASRLGRTQEAIGWSQRSTHILSCWTAGFILSPPPTPRGEGGEFIDAASSHRGIAGHHRTGLLGAVG